MSLPARLAVVIALTFGACSEPAAPDAPDTPDTPPAEVAAPDAQSAATDPAAPETPTPPDDDVADAGGPPPVLPIAGPDTVWMRKGLMIGTWSLDPELGLDEEWFDEAGLRETFTKVRVKRREWRGFATQSPLVPLDILMDRKPGPIFGYVYGLVQRNRLDATWPDEEAVIHLTHRGPVKGWFDGELIFNEPDPIGGVATARATVTLTDAYDVLLLKLSSDEGESMNIEVGMTDLEGGPIEAMTWNTVRIPGIPREIGPRER